ncbi:MAG: hypothetical protein ACTHJZ_02335, partial [Trinickia sp.]|uniref:hypothetical protein n=1 Tax=Trinickia sp. TaxID=2571163 RepID=UPI003F7F178F
PSSEVDKDGFSDTKISTFTPSGKSFLLDDRDKTFDIDGDLYRKGGDWIIKTSTAQAGCENSAGTFIFDRDTSDAITYSITQEIPAIGIRLVKSKSYFYDYISGRYVVRKGYLTKWSGVVVLKTQDDFSYVRFVDPHIDAKTSGKITTGWIHSNDLVNPFPLSSK